MSTGSVGIPDVLRSPTIDQVGVEERVERLQKRSIKKASKVHALKLALSMIDLTTLEGADSDGKVRQLCSKAKHLHGGAAGFAACGGGLRLSDAGGVREERGGGDWS